MTDSPMNPETSDGSPSIRQSPPACQLLVHPLIKDDLQRRQQRRTRSSERHNIFDALGVGHKEIYHSRFIGYLFDPHERHDQGPRFLRPFVEWLGFAGSALENLSAARVAVEMDTAGEGRVDLVISLGDGTTIAIENKVHAGEQERQLERYWSWLRRLGKDTGKLRLVFLTPEGRSSVSAHANDPVVCMSYGALASILGEGLKQCPDSASPLVNTTQQYIQLCQRIEQREPDMGTLNPQILDFLQQPEHLAAALDIRDHLDKAVEGIRQRFRDNIIEALQNKLHATPGASALWQAGTSDEYQADQLIGLLPRTGATPYGYRCVLEIFFSHREAVIGWCRPQRISFLKQAPRDTSALEEQMRARQGEPTDYWLSRRVMPHSEAMTRPLREATSESVKALHADNRSGTKALANHLADAIWAYFEPHYKGVEPLQFAGASPSN